MATEIITELEVVRHTGLPPANSHPQACSEGRTLHGSEENVITTDRSASSYTLSKTRGVMLVLQLAGTEYLSSFSNGTLTIALPTMAKTLSLHDDLLLWPNSVYFLTCGTLLLVAGAIADVIGPRKVSLTGCLLLATFILACGFARTPIELIIFRAMTGIAYAMTSPSSVSLITAGIESGTRRNISFACMGIAKLIGFSSGLVLGGVLVSTAGWRTNYYIGGALGFLLFSIGIWALPADRHTESEVHIVKRLRSEIDWPGAFMASAALATLSYLLAVLSFDAENIKQGGNIAILVVSLTMFAGFIGWMQWQEKHGRPALVPNSLWRRASFTTICVMIMLSNAVTEAMELFCSLFFQDVQGKSALQASLRILPSLLVGAVLSFTTGVLVNRIPVSWAVLGSTALCTGAPLLMAVIQPQWPYRYDAFFAQLLAPMSSDVLFTVGLLVVSDSFPARTQALAGAVFNTFSQIGVSISLTAMSVISTSVINNSSVPDKSSPQALMAGYRAAFWTMVAWMASACIIGIVGLRGLGKVGVKRE